MTVEEINKVLGETDKLIDQDDTRQDFMLAYYRLRSYLVSLRDRIGAQEIKNETERQNIRNMAQKLRERK